ncbi:MAG TPA: AmmeMemoRadiSam system protein A [Vicinamibacterales bacterium]|nr:AmmeMemoRadiSam system protein A [Vicinamibacterales bacterium]
MLTETQRARLLALARESLERHLAGDPSLPVIKDVLPEASGVFVTIKTNRQLRGCLGVLQMRRSLPEEVAHCVRSSATEDPRFPPLTAAELPAVSLEISVLGPLEEIDPHQEGAIVIGRHGLVVEQGFRRGLLLPQVAVEWNWTPEEFLAQTCRKAGLPADAWRRGARVHRFDAQVFGE